MLGYRHTDRLPAAQVWSVAKNASYKDRPTYPVTNGVRGTKSDGRVNVGTACDCSKPIVEGKTTYCPRAAISGKAALEHRSATRLPRAASDTGKAYECRGVYAGGAVSF